MWGAMKSRHLFISLLIILTTITGAHAEDTDFGSQKPSTDQVIEALSPKKLRGLKMKETALSMQINFKYNSAELTEVAKDNLQPVGEALVDQKLNGLKYVVEGHTDAAGSATFNKTLSKQRAAAVKRYFVETIAVDPNRLVVIGKGESQLLDAKKPNSAVNRRVRLVAKE